MFKKDKDGPAVRVFTLRDLAGGEMARGTMSEVAAAAQEKWPTAGIVGAQWNVHDGTNAVACIKCEPMPAQAAPAVEPETHTEKEDRE